MQRRTIILLIVGVVLCLALAIMLRDTAWAPKGAATVTHSVTRQSIFSSHEYSTTNPSSIWVIVNKQHPLSPINYTPAHLVVPKITLRSNITSDERHVNAIMAPALEQMAAAAKQAGLTLTLESGYRSYGTQVSLYGSYAKQYGQTAADRFSARPGYSEHQTGFAADLGGTSQPACNVAACYANTTEGKWLAAHAYQYGFIIRYTTAKESVTGYENEPWHVRYIGVALAAEMHQRGILTLEEFFQISGGTSYTVKP